MKCFIHSFIHSFHFIFFIYSRVDIFVFISTIHLLFHAKQKYRTRELSYCYDHNARNLDPNSPYWCIDAKHQDGVWDFSLDRRQLLFIFSNFQVSWSSMTTLNTICLTHSIWKTSFITINGAQRHHFCFLAYMTWHTVRYYHCVQNIFHLLENSFFPFFFLKLFVWSYPLRWFHCFETHCVYLRNQQLNDCFCGPRQVRWNSYR